MANKHLYLTEFGSGLPLIHWAAENPSDFSIHTRNSALTRYLSNLGLKYDGLWDFHPACTSVYIGTSAEPANYDHLILKARMSGIKSYAYFDSWVNYRNRISVEPTEILISDPWAYALAREKFSNLKVSYFKEYHLKYLLNSYYPKLKEYVLYLDSPINSYNNAQKRKHKIDCICELLPKVTELLKLPIIFRKHPGYEANECLRFLNSVENVKLSHNPESLISDLELAKYVVGPVSYVHYLAENLGIPAFTAFEPNSNWQGPKFRSLNL